jgi:hypothetical protein
MLVKWGKADNFEHGIITTQAIYLISWWSIFEVEFIDRPVSFNSCLSSLSFHTPSLASLCPNAESTNRKLLFFLYA